MPASLQMKLFGAVVLALGTFLLVISVRVRLKTIEGPRERALFLQMSIFIAVLVAVALAWIWLAPRNLSHYARWMLLPSVLAVPWFNIRMRQAREQDLQSGGR